MRTALAIAAAALVACQQGEAGAPAGDTAQAGGSGAAKAPAAPAAPGPAAEAPAGPAGPAVEARNPAPVDDALPEKQRRRILGFCVHNLRRTLRCFDDDAYWDTFLTHYYATSGGGRSTPEHQQRITGILKDDILTLQREDRFVENCENMVSTQKLPTEEQMQKVEATYDRSCAEYASALGWMIFHERVFHDPR